jgi:hypothetical protein
MARWNVSGETLTLEEGGGRRSPSAWLRQNGLKIAVVLGVVEAVVAWRLGLTQVMVPVALLAVLGYLWARRRFPPSVRRPLWVVTVAQAVAGLVPLAIGAGIVIAVILGSLLLVIMLLVLLGDRRR